jgi:hypothetical protein
MTVEDVYIRRSEFSTQKVHVVDGRVEEIRWCRARAHSPVVEDQQDPK